MDVACTLLCPKLNKEVIVTDPTGNETQKCEKCEGDCPKGWDRYVCVCVLGVGRFGQKKNIYLE